VCEITKDLELPWTKLNGVTPHGAPGMARKKARLMDKIRGEMDKKDPEFYIKLHWITHQQSLCVRTLNFEL
jgi:hypothetical protein